MSTLYDAFSKSIPKGLVNTVKQGFTNSNSGIFSALFNMKTRLRESVSNMTGLLSAFDQDSSIITDKAVDWSDTEFEVSDDFTGVIDDYIAQNMYDTIHAYSRTIRDTDNPNGIFSVSGQDGRFYQFVCFDQPVAVDGYSVYIATCENPISLADFLLYKDGDDWMLNPIILSSDYDAPVPIPSENDVEHKLRQICYLLDVNYGDQGELGAAHNILASKEYPISLGDNLEQACNDLVLCFNVENTSNINDDLANVVLKVLQEEGRHGGYCLLYDLLPQMKESNDLNSFITDVADYLCGDTESGSDVIQYVLARSNSEPESVQACSEGCIEAANQGGLFGVARYLLSYIQGLTSINTSEAELDGYMSLTDNYSYVPQSFLVGVVTGIATSIGALVGGVISAFNPIIGLLVSGASLLVNTIATAVQYNYSKAVNASIINDTKSKANMFPIAAYQGRIKFDDYAQYSSLLSIVNELQAKGIYIYEVVGGYLVVGLAASTSTNFKTWPDLVYEFHPGVSDNRELLKYVEINLLSGHLEQEIYKYFVVDRIDPDIRDFILEYYGAPGYSDEIDWYNDAVDEFGNTVLNNEHDAELRELLMTNFCLFTLVYDKQFTDLSVGSRFRISDNTIDQMYGLNLFGYCYDNITSQNVPAWDVIISRFANSSLAYDNVLDTIITYGAYILNQHWYIGLPTITTDPDFKYPVGLPQYDRTSIWTTIVIGAIITVAATFIAIRTSVRARKAIRAGRAKRKVDAENAWDNYKKSPTSENYKAYVKSVKKNNRFAAIFGGDKLSRTGFWESTTSGDNVVSGFLSDNQDTTINNEASETCLRKLWEVTTGKSL